MKTINYSRLICTILIMLALWTNSFAQTVFTTSGTWTVPAGVTSVQVILFGGGGAGVGTNTAPSCFHNGGGGGGGACAVATVAVTPGHVYTITVGAGGLSNSIGAAGGNGGTTTFSGPAGTWTAGGGFGAVATVSASGLSNAGGAGSTTGTGPGVVVRSGGNGSEGFNGSGCTPDWGGSGGGSGGSGSNGTSALSGCPSTAGTGGSGSFPGGNGAITPNCSVASSNTAGVNGSFPGGGGSGCINWSPLTLLGGNGGGGEVIIVSPCSSPIAQPTSLVLTPVSPSIIGVSFTAASGSDSYLTVRYPAGATEFPPVNGVSYLVGGTTGGSGVVVSNSAATSFNATGLALGASYDFYVYSMNSLCSGGPLYLTAGRPSGTQTTPAFVNAIVGGLWSSPATWGGAVPTSTDNVVIPAGSIVTIDVAPVINNLTVDGVLQWGASTVALTALGNITISPTGKFYGFSSAGGGQTINCLGNFTNNGYANLALSGLQFAGSGTQTLGGSGTYQGNGTRGLVAGILMQGSGTLNVAVPLNIRTLTPLIGNITGASNIELDINQAQIFNQSVNSQINNVIITAMGSSLTAAPVVFGASVTAWSNITGVVGALYFSGNNVYRCTAAANIGPVAPTHTGTTIVQNLLWIGTLGSLGNPFNFNASAIAGTQYFYGGNLYTCTVTGTPSSAAPPVHTSGIATSGTATFQYVGTVVQVSVNYHAASQTVRSVTITSPGSGYSNGSPTAVFTNVGTGTLPTIVALGLPALVPAAGSVALIQKNPLPTLSGTPIINSSQGISVPTSATGGRYVVAPTVSFTPPNAVNYITLSGASGGAGCTVAPTATFTGGTITNGGTNTFTVTVAAGKIIGLVFSGTATFNPIPTAITFTGGTFITAPTSPSSAALSALWPAATAQLNANGQLINYTLTNTGGGYITAPTMFISAAAAGEVAATTPTCRVALYNLSCQFFTSATINGVTPVATNGVHNESTNLAGCIPSNRKINILLSGFAQGINFTGGDITLYNSAPHTFGASTGVCPIDLGGNGLIYSHYAYAGINSSAVNWVQNGSITSNLFGTATAGGTRIFPFRATGATGAFQLFVGSGASAPSLGSDINQVRITQMGAPSGSASGVVSSMIGTRAFKVEILSGSVFGATTLPTVLQAWDGSDNLPTDNQSLYLAQSNTGLTSGWAVRTAAGAAGALAATGTRTTATTGNGPIVFASTMFFGWSSSFVPPPALNYAVTRTTGNVYQSIAPIARGGDGTGTLSSATGDEGTQLISLAGLGFTYQGSTCTGITVHTNGLAMLNNGFYTYTAASNWDNTLCSSGNGFAGTPDLNKRNVLAVFYDDLNKTDGATTPFGIYYKVSGTKATIEWWNTTYFGLAGPQLYFQIVLDASDQSITYNYGDMQLYNGTQNIRYSYSCGISGAFVQAIPQPGQIMQQQYENTTIFTNENTNVANWGANGLSISPAPHSSIKFTPGSYVAVSPPANAPPANDEPAGAIVRPSLLAFPNNIAWDYVNNNSNLFTTRFATNTPSPASCAGPSNARDVWFKFTANNASATVRIYGSGGFIPRVSCYDNSLNLISGSCSVGTQGLIVNSNLTGLIVGQDYYIRVSHDLTGTTATAVANASGGSVTSLVVTSGSNYTDPNPPFGYVAANRNARVTFTGGGGQGANAGVTTALTGGVLAQANVAFTGGTGYTSAPTVTFDSPDWGITGEFGIIIFAKAANDECATATNLTGISTPGCTPAANAAVGQTTLAASNSAEPACSGIADDDIWYKFTAVNTSTTIGVQGYNNFDAVVEIWNGGASPGNCGTKVLENCLNSTFTGGAEGIVKSTIIGNTYFIRVYHSGIGGGAAGDAFDICVSSAPPACVTNPLPATSCSVGTILSWSPSVGATGYNVIIDGITVSSNQAATSFNASSLAVGLHTWNVQPINLYGPNTSCANFTLNVFQTPTINVAPNPTTICTGASVGLTASGADTYSWSPSLGLSSSTGASLTANPTTTTSYTVTGTVTSSGCTSTTAALVNVVAPPVIASVTANPASTCIGGSTTLTAVIPTTQLYHIAAANLVNCPNNCGNGPYSLCPPTAPNNPGFTWMDAGGAAPVSITIQLGVGVECNAGITHTTFLNGVATTATFAQTPNNCACTGVAPQMVTITFVPTNYNVGGLNTFMIGNHTSCFGFENNTFGFSPIGADYAQVTASYPGSSSVVWTATGPGGLSSNITNPTTGTGITGSTVYSVTATNGTCTSSPSTVTVAPGGPLSTVVTATPPPSTAGYVVSQIAYAPVSPPGGTNAGPVGDDILSGAIPIGFNFTFYGNTYSNLYISTNGFITFNASSGAGCCSSPLLPSAGILPDNLVALDWVDLNTSSGGNIDYFNLTGPNRFVARWNNVSVYTAGGGTGLCNGQIILYEDGTMEVHSTSITTNYAAHPQSQGIENAGGTLATTVPGRNSVVGWVATNDAFRFAIPPPATTPCPGLPWTLSAVTTGGGLPYTYAWSGVPAVTAGLVTTNTATVTAIPLAPTTYTVVITDNCNVTTTQSVFVDVRVTNPTIGTVTASSTAGCGVIPATPNISGVPVIFSLDAFTGDNLIWQFNVNGGAWTTIPGAVTPTVTLTPTIPQGGGPVTFGLRAQSYFCAINPATSNAITFIMDDPSAPTAVTGGVRCGPGIVPVSASVPAGQSVEWYSAATGGTLLGTGSSFNYPATVSTTIYAAHRNPATGCLGSLRTAAGITVNIIPTVTATNNGPVCVPNAINLTATGPAPAAGGTFTNGPPPTAGISNAFPFNTGTTTPKLIQWFVAPGEFNSPTPAVPGTISSLRFFALTTGSATFTNFTIRLGQSSSPFAGGSTYSGPMNVVVGPANTLVSAPTALDWTSVITLETPFSYDPSQWLIVEVSHCGYTGTGWQTPQNTLGGVRRTYNDGGFSCSPLFVGNDASMAGITIQLTPPSFGYSWTGPNSYTSLVQNPVITPSILTHQGVYSVTITDNGTGCNSSASTSVVVNAAPQIVSLQSATLAGGVAQSFPNPPNFLDIPNFTTATTCDKVVNYNVAITGTPAPAVTYGMTGATTVPSGTAGIGSGTSFGRAIPSGRTTVTVTAGNVCATVNKTFRVTVLDNVAPVITPIQVPATGTNGGECNSVVQVTQPTLGNGLFDNCPNSSLNWLSRSDGRSQFDPYTVGTTTVTWAATDASLNTSTATQNVVVTNFKPVVTSFTAAPGNVIFVGQTATFTVNFTDEDGGGTHTIKFYRDKNDISPASIKTIPYSPCVNCNGNKNYTMSSDPILYSVSEVAEPKVEIFDGCNQAADQVPGVTTVMYLAIAVAGQQFTTAGGHFVVPAGAFPSNYEGYQVNIGNVCKKATTGNSYKGQLEMNVHLPNGTNWRIHTDNGSNQDITWDYLTVSGCSLATFKGAVLVNGVSGYKALVQQSDKDRNPATSNFIRVKVTTNSGTLVFDTQPGLTEALTAGNGGAAAIIVQMDGGSVKVQPANGCTAKIDDANMTDKVLQNIPNPFTGQTEIRFNVPEDGTYTLTVYNYLGQEVTTLFKGDAVTGSIYSVMFDGTNLGEGIYTYTLRGTSVNETRRMNLIK